MEEWRYFASKSRASQLFPSLITMLCAWERVPRDQGAEMIVCDVPFDPLRVKGALGWGRKKRNTDLKEDSEDQGSSRVGAGLSRPSSPFECIEENMAVMKELLRFLSRPLPDGALSNAAAGAIEAFQGALGSLVQAHMEFQADLEAEKKKRRSQDKLLTKMWEGIKAPEDSLSTLKASQGVQEGRPTVLLP
ncbi:hypothetical protein HAX54_040837 [Datura stramonium]|uniref:Uncharacterized protein n=1 Tax=Datura stramonium TaxID=4076 RepID=A0ABS8VRU9_DATST|nr:hypothetical protein [Datura stramonium]